MPACITGEVCTVLDFAVGERTRVKYPIGVSGEAKGIPLALQVAALQWHPAQRAPAPPPQERAVLLAAGFGVLLADGVDRSRMQRKFLAAPRGQPIKVKAGRPALVPFQRMQLSLVTEIPDEVARARLAVEQTGQGFDAVPIDQEHRRKLMRLKRLSKILKLRETSIFTLSRAENVKSWALVQK